MEPNEARRLWQELLASAQAMDGGAGVMLSLILESVVIDIIHNKIKTDDTFACVIGQRIATLKAAGIGVS